MQNEMDLICPVYWLDWNYFSDNFKSWIKELPLRNIYIGVNSPNHSLLYSWQLDKRIKVIDQTHFKTLGACLRDLMERVETHWFAYLHADARITPYSFEVMRKYMHRPKTGIIESERIHYNGKEWIMCDPPYHECDRSFSGFQIIRKYAIESILPKIDDDYIYRNEDIVFQSECLKNGFTYEKTWAMHIHQTTNKAWTFSKEETYRMQILGIIKYCEPNPITIKHLKGTLYPYLMECTDYLSMKQEIIMMCQKYPKWDFLINMFHKELNMY